MPNINVIINIRLIYVRNLFPTYKIHFAIYLSNECYLALGFLPSVLSLKSHQRSTPSYQSQDPS